MLVCDIRVWDGARGWRILGVGLRFGMKLEDGESIKLEDLLGLFHNSQAAYNGVNHRTCNNGWVCHRIILFNCLIFKLCSQNENSFDRQIRDLNSLFWLTQHVQQFCHSISLSYSKTFFFFNCCFFFCLSRCDLSIQQSNHFLRGAKWTSMMFVLLYVTFTW